MGALVVIWIGFAVVSAIVASNKGRNPAGWFLLGLVFGVFALIAVAVMSSSRSQVVTMSGQPAGGPTRACPHCMSQIPLDAHVCRFCQRDVPDAIAEGRQKLAAGVCPSCGKPVGSQAQWCQHCSTRFAGTYR